MAAIIDFAISLIQWLIQAWIWVVIVWAIMSWLIAFNIINGRNPTVLMVLRFLDAVTRPVLRPLQRFIPTLGGVDVTPIIAVVVLTLASSKLLTPLKYYLMGLVA